MSLMKNKNNCWEITQILMILKSNSKMKKKVTNKNYKMHKINYNNSIFNLYLNI